MAKLNQIVAVTKGKKSAVEKTKTEVYHDIQKPTLFDGIVKTYQPKKEDGDVFPDEKKIVQVKVKDCISRFRDALVEMFDAVATQEFANTKAAASVFIGERDIFGKPIPLTYLLFLEKQLVDIHTFISKLPTVDPSVEWEYDDKTDTYASLPVKTVKTKKVPTAFVLAEATEHHKAQVERVDVDELIGYWTTINFSGAIKASEKNAMLERVKQMSEAVKFAREKANTLEVEYEHPAKPCLDFIFKGV